MLKTLKRKIALVAVAVLGASGLAVVAAPSANAALTATGQANFQVAGTTSAVTNAAGAFNAGAGAAVETVYVRSTATTNTFKVNFTNLTAADVVHITMSTTTSVAATAAELVAITKGADPTGGTCAQEDVTTAGGAVGATTKGIACTENATGTVLTGVSFTTGALAAGTYTIWVNTTANLATGTTYKIATVTSYAVGAPSSVAFDKKVTSVGLVDASYTVTVKDSASRSTFLVGDETINYSLDPVASPVKTMDAPTATTSGSTPVLTAGVYAGYTVALDANNADDTKDASAGNTYVLNAVIQNGVVSYGSTTTTYRYLATTNGLQGTITVLLAADSTEVSSLTLAQSDTVATGTYKIKVTDSTGAVVAGVTPTVTLTAGSGGGGASATTAAANAAGTGTADAFAATYTAPATGTADSITWSLNAGTAGTISKTVAVTLNASVAKNTNSAILSVAGNGGFDETGTAAVADDLSDGTTATAAAIADPSNTTKLTTGISVYLTAAPNTPAAGGVLSVSLAGSTTPTANMTASATSVTLDASGKASVDVTVTAARATETVEVVFKSGSVVIGTATYTFTASAVAIGDVSMGPAQAITSKAGTSTVVTVTAVDQYLQAKANQRIQLSIVGPSAPASSPVLLTGADGKVSYTVTGTTAVTGQTDTVAISHLNTVDVTGTRGADDVVTITYTSGDVAAASMTVEYALDEDTPTYALQSTTAIATAIAAATNDAGADLNEDAAHLTPDTNGDWTDNAVYGLGGINAAEDEVVALRFTVKNAAGTALSGVKVTVTAPAGGFIRSSATVKVSTIDLYTNTSGQVTAQVWSTKVGDAVFTASVGSVTASQTIPYGTSNIGPTNARYITLTPATASVAGGNAQLMTAKVTDRFGNPVKGATVTFTEVGTGRLTGTPAVTSAAGTSEVDFTTLIGETGTSTVTASMTGYQELNEAGKVGTTTGTKTTPFTDDATAGVASATAALTVTAATATSSPEVTAVKADVKAVSDTVATLSKAVTTIQSSVTELTSSFSAQIKSLSSAIAKISRAIAALSKKIK